MGHIPKLLAKYHLTVEKSPITLKMPGTGILSVTAWLHQPFLLSAKPIIRSAQQWVWGFSSRDGRRRQIHSFAILPKAMRTQLLLLALLFSSLGDFRVRIAEPD
jgi:hypothetical protein